MHMRGLSRDMKVSIGAATIAAYRTNRQTPSHERGVQRQSVRPRFDVPIFQEDGNDGLAGERTGVPIPGAHQLILQPTNEQVAREVSFSLIGFFACGQSGEMTVCQSKHLTHLAGSS